MALSSNGDAFTWGVAMYGQLGHGNQFNVKDHRKVDRNVPTRGVESISTETIVKVACGAHHTAALTSRGNLCTWYVLFDFQC